MFISLPWNLILVCLNMVSGSSPSGSVVKNPPTMQEKQSLNQEDPLEDSIATHSGILAWRTPWTEEPGRLPSIGYQSQMQLSMYASMVLFLLIFLDKVCTSGLILGHYLFPVLPFPILSFYFFWNWNWISVRLYSIFLRLLTAFSYSF